MSTTFYGSLLADVTKAVNAEGAWQEQVPHPRADDASALELPVRLRRFLQERLPPYMLPSSIILLERMPLTAGGKLDRITLASRVPSSGRRTASEALTTLERVIVGVWCEVLNLDDVGATQNFFDLGGDSILIVQVRSHLASILKRELSVLDLFRYPTIGSLAEHLGGALAGSDMGGEKAHERAHLQRAVLEQKRRRHSIERSEAR
jgi:hypothetical protein